MDVVVSDLDGTLLDHHTYSFQAALPALRLLREKKVPLVLSSSKTRSEMEHWRTLIGSSDPFIAENGGCVYVPEGYFPFAVPAAQTRGGYHLLELGTGYAELVESLQAASARSGCRVRGFHQMDAEEISTLCGLAPEIARLARQREFDEPFVVLDPEREQALVDAIEGAGKRCTRGGRFLHIVGDNDKAAALERLIGLYRRLDPEVRTIGLGDGLNDIPFLKMANVAYLIHTPWIDRMQRAVPPGRATANPGPAGWCEAILELYAGGAPAP
ncbi:MAG: HAD-IIB family hydrolase [Bryobacterales bacterium]|nr:HAD-IIB family hydrolase [Bryobacterales bacterium]